MEKTITLLCTLLIYSTFALSNRRFPSGFKLGTASASYQVEGGWNADGKGPNIFDAATHAVPSPIKDNSTGDIACDSYHKYKEDVSLLKDLGVDFYRFSLSWARILPNGFVDNVNQPGVQYYKNLLAALKSANIEPLVTIFHWDLPLSLHDLGNWLNPAMIDYYLDYVNFVFETFGDDVKMWVTFNEPHMYCTRMLPQAADLRYSGMAEYTCAHNILKAHAKAYRLYDEKFRSKQNGNIAIALDTHWNEPFNASNQRDIDAAERNLLFVFGWYAHPVVYGNYPQVMIDRIGKRSAEEGFVVSRLPKFSLEEQTLLKGSYDLIGLNHYTTYYAEDLVGSAGSRYENDIGVHTFQDESWEQAGSEWLRVVPWGFRKQLNWIKETYQSPAIAVTENGYSDFGELNNERRTNYYKEYLSAALDAIYEDTVNLVAYAVWSLLDSFEWWDGYTVKFGLYQVDFNDPDRRRTPKGSVKYYQQVIKTRCLADSCVD